MTTHIVIPNYSVLNYSITRKYFFKDPGNPGDSNSPRKYSLMMANFSGKVSQ
jgi:hypothetical protein